MYISLVCIFHLYKYLIRPFNIDFFEETENGITLNRKGHEALLRRYNYAQEVNNTMSYGGVNRLEYQFSVEQNKLIKTILHGD